MIDSKDEDTTARLLRIAGPRPEVPADRADRVRQAVHLQWQAGARRRAVRRRVVATTALLATAASVTLILWLAVPHEDGATPLGEIVAAVERIDGTTRLARNAAVRTDEWVETNATSRVALRIVDGTSVRLDAGSRARLRSSTVIELTHGALYIDTGRDATGLEVRTPFGTAHDIGTQFEVRLRDSSLRLRVRTGVVELRRRNQSIQARSGTELTIASAGDVSRPVSTHGPEWEWAASLAPAFDIEGRTLAAFLEHLSREHGWTLRYADAALAREASGIILHGSVSGLKPREALAVALETSGLAHRFEDGDVFVFRPAKSK